MNMKIILILNGITMSLISLWQNTYVVQAIDIKILLFNIVI